jgi:Protein of unknown function (DUF3095)
MSGDGRDFYGSLPVFDDFAAAVRAANHAPLPDDWALGFADVVGSTKAIAEGWYKAVNFVVAGAIAAVANSLGQRSFPLVFGGDGAAFAVSVSDSGIAGRALAALAAFSRAEFDLDMHVAMLPVREIRAAGHDVRVARFAASERCIYAMVSGGGLSWFEERAKRGEYALDPAPPNARPDLAGLSCRWGLAPAKRGLLLSLIVAPRGDDPRYPVLIEEIVRMADDGVAAGRPVTPDMLGMADPGAAIALEASALKSTGASALKARVQVAASYAVGATFHRFKLKAGGFDAAVLAADVAAAADFRKFDDRLRMTLDCSLGFADALEARLAAADDFADWGLFRQKAAQITSLVPTIAERGPIHFVDGAEGGYTMAASALRARRLLKASMA